MTDLLIALPLGLFYFASILVCGLFVTRRFVFPDGNILLRYGFSIACGLGVFGFLWSILAAIPNGMQSLSVLIVLAVFLILGRQSLFAVFHDAQNILINSKSIFWPEEKYLRWLITPLILFILLAGTLAFHPLGTDALAFYFAQAKLIAYANNFVPLSSYESFAQIPLPAELNYTALILLGSEWAARLVTTFEFWACALLITGSIYQLNNKNIYRAWLGMFLLVTSTGVTLLISDGKTDLYAAMLGFAACYLSLIIPLDKWRYRILLGFFVGFSFTAKLSYVPILVPMIGLIIFARLWRENNFKTAVIQSFIIGFTIGICILMAFLPNAAKNFLAYGEPLAPFFLFNTNNAAEFLDQAWFSPEITRYIRSIYPIAWTYGQFPMQHGNLSPFVWAALPAVFFVQWKTVSIGSMIDNKSVLLGIAGCLGMLSWAIFYPSVIAPRYISPALFAFIPLAAIGLDQVWNAVRVNRAAHIAFLSILFLGSLMVIANNLSALKQAARNILQGPQETQLHYLNSVTKEAEKVIPSEGRLFLAAWERALFEPKTLSCMLSFEEQTVLNDSSKYWKTLYNYGTRVVLINISTRQDVLNALNPAQKPDWLEIKSKKLNKGYIMYVIVPKSHAPPSQWACRETAKNYYKPVELE